MMEIDFEMFKANKYAVTYKLVTLSIAGEATKGFVCGMLRPVLMGVGRLPVSFKPIRDSYLSKNCN